MLNCSFRSGQKEDISVLLSLVRGLAEYEKMPNDVKATEELYSKNFEYFDSLLICRDNETIGFVIYFFTFSTFTGKPTLYVENIYLEPEYRGKGFGKATFKYLAELAVRKGCGRMEWVVLDWNDPSIKFYESIGAQQRKDLMVCQMNEDKIKALINKS